MPTIEHVTQQSITYDECGLRIGDSVTLEELKGTLRTLDFAEKNHAYFIGDLLCHLAASADKEHPTAVERQKVSIYKTFLEQNKHSLSSLHRYRKVCKAYSIEERQKYNKQLSFNHYYESLVLTRDDKKAALEVLDNAAANDLSLSEMRACYREENKVVEDEPEISVSPVNELCDLANELSRKLIVTRLSYEECQLLFVSLAPVVEWAKGFAATTTEK